jgi:hypothetical protein
LGVDVRLQGLDNRRRDRHGQRWIAGHDFATDGSHFAVGDFAIVVRDVELVGDALFADAANSNADVEYIVEASWSLEVATRRHTRPTNGHTFVLHFNVQSNVPEQRMFGLFHVVKEAREMYDSGRIRLAKFDTSGEVEGFGHLGKASVSKLLRA